MATTEKLKTAIAEELERHDIADHTNLGRYKTKVSCTCGDTWVTDWHSELPQPNMVDHTAKAISELVHSWLPEVVALPRGHSNCSACRVETDLVDSSFVCPSCNTSWTPQGGAIEASADEAELNNERSGDTNQLEGIVCPNADAWRYSDIADPIERERLLGLRYGTGKGMSTGV